MFAVVHPPRAEFLLRHIFSEPHFTSVIALLLNNYDYTAKIFSISGIKYIFNDYFWARKNLIEFVVFPIQSAD
jgi:hypothetical protein